MFEYLARLDVADLDGEAGHPPLSVASVVHLFPSVLVFDPVATATGVAAGYWAPEQWDGFENVGVYRRAEGTPVAMSVAEASDYLSHDW